MQRVVVLVGSRPSLIVRAVAESFPDAAVHVIASVQPDPADDLRPDEVAAVHVCDTVDAMQMAIVRSAPPQLLVDGIEGATPRAAVRRFTKLLLALPDGATYVVLPGAGSSDRSEAKAVLRAARNLRRRVATPVAAKRRGAADAPVVDGMERRHERELGHAVRQIRSRRGVVLVIKRGTHLAKLRDDDVDDVVRGRYGDDRAQVLTALAATTFRPRGRTKTNSKERRRRWLGGALEIPELYLREHHGVLCAPRQLAALDDVILPSSFHHPAVRWPRCRATVECSTRFARLPRSLPAPTPLEGPFFHLDSEFPGHFGHFFTEDIAKLWGWHDAKRRHPDLRVLLSVEEPGATPRPYHFEALAAFGIQRTEVVAIDRPVHVELLVTASPMMHNGAVIYVHPGIAEVWDRLRDGLRSGARGGPDRIFVTRPDEKRSCLNRAEVEQAFALNGFQIVRPELLPLADQVETFASAAAIAGFAGSGMFNAIYSEAPGTRIVIASDTYKASNEFLISAVKGDDFHFFSSPIGPPNPESLRPNSMFHRDFVFDFERDGAALDRLLRRL